MIHLIQLLLQLLLRVDGELPDNSRLAGSLFIGGVWLLLIAKLFPRQLGPWLDWCLWTGWICVGLATFMFVRRKIWIWRGTGATKKGSTILR